jgi:transcriptional regulator with XRE-family HTH domain
MSKIDFSGFMHRKKITQSRLAKVLGVTQQSVNSYCKGKSDITFGKVEKLIDLGITIEELHGETAGKKLREMCVNDYLAEKGKEADVLKEVRELRARVEDLEAKNQFRKPAGQGREAARETG